MPTGRRFTPRRSGIRPRIPRVDAFVVPTSEPGDRSRRRTVSGRFLSLGLSIPRLCRKTCGIRSISAKDMNTDASGAVARAEILFMRRRVDLAMMIWPGFWVISPIRTAGAATPPQRLLVERKAAAAIVPLAALARSSPVPLARVHALWTLDGLDALDTDTLRAGLSDRDPLVREQAARLAEERGMETSAQLAAVWQTIRMHACGFARRSALANLDTDAAPGALARITAPDGDSPWTTEVVLMGLGHNATRFLENLTTRQSEWLKNPTAAQARFLTRLAERVGLRNDREELQAVLSAAAWLREKSPRSRCLGA